MRLVPTLAYQLAQSLSGLRPLIEDQVTQDPAIFKKSPMMQLEHLILRPISRLLPNLRNALTLRNDNKPFGPCLIVIDALDECGGLHSRDNQIIAQKRVLEVLQELAEHHHKVYPFRILILSRTEQHLRRCFLDPGLQRVSSEILLDDSQLPDNDIVFYTAHEFMLITEKHPDRHSLPKHWPGREIIGWIARNASGQFIYAVTVMRFIRSPRHRPVERLQAILDQAQYRTESLSPLARLDDMYRQILSYSPNMQMTKRILAFQLIQELKASHSKALMTLEGVERGLDISPGSIRHALGDLEPLLFIHGISDTSSKFDIHFHHASFVDFLTNSYRSHEWYTDLAIFAQEFLHISLKALDDCEG
ncbi:hypothetical protein BJ165DRAFT_927272 [Panaeolus papilionaceus]|nr:hypothetical protein BJ165DRAFT_927272 [Panaeolus papilionaceus]